MGGGDKNYPRRVARNTAAVITEQTGVMSLCLVFFPLQSLKCMLSVAPVQTSHITNNKKKKIQIKILNKLLGFGFTLDVDVLILHERTFL